MTVRALRQNELTIVQGIFQAGLVTSVVRIEEGSQVSETVGRIGAFIRGRPSPKVNAITVRNTSYFPRALSTSDVDLGWLMHELTHQWQYQHFGMVYLLQAVLAPTYVYCRPGETPTAALARCTARGWTFANFNREQQGDIVRDYYFALRAAQQPGGDAQSLAAWAPYLAVLRQPKH